MNYKANHFLSQYFCFGTALYKINFQMSLFEKVFSDILLFKKGLHSSNSMSFKSDIKYIHQWRNVNSWFVQCLYQSLRRLPVRLLETNLFFFFPLAGSVSLDELIIMTLCDTGNSWQFDRWFGETSRCQEMTHFHSREIMLYFLKGRKLQYIKQAFRNSYA